MTNIYRNSQFDPSSDCSFPLVNVLRTTFICPDWALVDVNIVMVVTGQHFCLSLIVSSYQVPNGSLPSMGSALGPEGPGLWPFFRSMVISVELLSENPGYNNMNKNIIVPAS
jgi:hypothetical protein